MFLESIPHEILRGIYNAMQILSFPAVALVGLVYAKHYGLQRKKGCIYSLAVYVLLFGLMYLIPKVVVLFGLSGSINSSRCFLLVLIPTLIYSRWFKISPLEGCDFVAPGLYIARAIGKLGCVIFGCCHGIACEWGMYSHAAHERVFPLHLIEMLSCVLITVVVLLYSKRKNYNAGGKAYAISMLMLGAVRYLGQFSTEKIFNEQSVYAILMILLGLAILYFADRKNL